MEPSDVFAGPCLRRASRHQVAIWLATTKPFTLSYWVRPVGATEWWHVSFVRHRLKVLPGLWVNLGIVTPVVKPFPTDSLLEYSIAIEGEDGTHDHSFFETIAKEDGLCYDGFSLPNFYLQGPRRPLSALYASCRKPHGHEQGNDDALAYGDAQIARDPYAANRPAMLCLTGDQIYADDVHDAVFDEVAVVAKRISVDEVEVLPKKLPLAGRGMRQDFVVKYAQFSSSAARNHLVTLAEYAAMYGLAWNQRNWSAARYPPEVRGYVDALPAVRRLMANIPTYMIFDDHEVTDDWNISLGWRNKVWAYLLGRRIVANALFAFWLFQAWGNDPDQYLDLLPQIQKMSDDRPDKFREMPNALDEFFWGFQRWEFHTPTVPFIYFLNTRTQRGLRGGPLGTDEKAPAYLKTMQSWMDTVQRLKGLLEKQSSALPLVLVAPAPVFGFSLLEDMQAWLANVAGPTTADYELWSHNPRHLLVFLSLCADQDVVLLSGDVHFAYTTTVRFSTFDGKFHRDVRRLFPRLVFPKQAAGSTPTYQFLYAARFIQLTSSGAKNSHGRIGSGFKAVADKDKERSWFVNDEEEVKPGLFAAGRMWMRASDFVDAPGASSLFVELPLDVAKVDCAFHQRHSDSSNQRYTGEHNLGWMTIEGKKVQNIILTAQGGIWRTWDFADASYWTPGAPVAPPPAPLPPPQLVPPSR